MSEMSNYLEEQLVLHIFRTGSFTAPSVLAIALLTTGAAEGDSGKFSTGTGVEVSTGSAYARVARNPADANWDAVTGGNGQTANTAAITFAQATGSWGTVSDMAIVDATTYDTGNMLFYSSVTTSRTIDNGDTAEFAASAITVTFA